MPSVRCPTDSCHVPCLLRMEETRDSQPICGLCTLPSFVILPLLPVGLGHSRLPGFSLISLTVVGPRSFTVYLSVCQDVPSLIFFVLITAGFFSTGARGTTRFPRSSQPNFLTGMFDYAGTLVVILHPPFSFNRPHFLLAQVARFLSPFSSLLYFGLVLINCFYKESRKSTYT